MRIIFQVDEDAFEALTECIAANTLEACEAVPAGEGATLANPIAATAIDMAGPARC